MSFYRFATLFVAVVSMLATLGILALTALRFASRIADSKRARKLFRQFARAVVTFFKPFTAVAGATVGGMALARFGQGSLPAALPEALRAQGPAFLFYLGILAACALLLLFLQTRRAGNAPGGGGPGGENGPPPPPLFNALRQHPIMYTFRIFGGKKRFQ